MMDEALHRILAELGELRGDVRALVSACARLDSRIDDHLAADERAHARQDERILEVSERHDREFGELMKQLARIEAGHEAAVRTAIVVSAVLGATVAALGEALLKFLAH